MSKRPRGDYDEHHLFPTSRYPQYRRAAWNRRAMKRGRHSAWHQLVVNKTPLEALVDLFHEFTPDDAEKLLQDPALEEFRALLERLPK